MEIALNGLAHANEVRRSPPDWRHCILATTRSLAKCCSTSPPTRSASPAPAVIAIEFEGIRERYLPDGTAHTKAEHHKSKYALRAAAMLHGGVDPGLLDEVQWWQTDDVWYWSLEALVAYVRAAADRTGHRWSRSAVGSLTNTASPLLTTSAGNRRPALTG